MISHKQVESDYWRVAVCSLCHCMTQGFIPFSVFLLGFAGGPLSITCKSCTLHVWSVPHRTTDNYRSMYLHNSLPEGLFQSTSILQQQLTVRRLNADMESIPIFPCSLQQVYA
jgi:hypothetical protein